MTSHSGLHRQSPDANAKVPVSSVLSIFTLRFLETDDEGHFLEKRWGTFRTGALLQLLATTAFFFDRLSLPCDAGSPWWLLQLAVTAYAAALLPLVGFVLLPIRPSRSLATEAPRLREALLLLSLAAVLLAAPLQDSACRPPRGPEGTEERLPLWMAAIVSLAHVALPLRWFQLALLDAATLCSLAAALLLRQEDALWPARLPHWALLAVALGSSSVGARRCERLERRMFAERVREDWVNALLERDADLHASLEKGPARSPSPDADLDLSDAGMPSPRMLNTSENGVVRLVSTLGPLRSDPASSSVLAHTRPGEGLQGINRHTTPGDSQQLGGPSPRQLRHSGTGLSTPSTMSNRVFGNAGALTDKLSASPSRQLRRSGTGLSNASSTISNRVFNNTAVLADIASVGRQEQWLIDEEEVRLTGGKIGAGGFGEVMAAYYYGTPVAVKKTLGACRGGSLVSVCNELRILRRLRHPNIVLLYGAIWHDDSDQRISLVLEFLHGSELAEFVRGRAKAGLPRPAGDLSRAQALTDIAAALRFLHARVPIIVHGDLKDDNVFVEPSPHVPAGCRGKLLDFGLSRLLTKHAQPQGGTLRWIAPEIIKERSRAPSAATDVFSFGRLCYFVVTGTAPFEGLSHEEIQEALWRPALPVLAWPAELGPFGLRLRAVVEACCTLQPSSRPSMSVLYADLQQHLGELARLPELLAEAHLGALPFPERDIGFVRRSLAAVLSTFGLASARPRRSDHQSALRKSPAAHGAAPCPPHEPTPTQHSEPTSTRPAESTLGAEEVRAAVVPSGAVLEGAEKGETVHEQIDDVAFV